MRSTGRSTTITQKRALEGAPEVAPKGALKGSKNGHRKILQKEPNRRWKLQESTKRTKRAREGSPDLTPPSSSILTEIQGDITI
jgi:hypothetical protein